MSTETKQYDYTDAGLDAFLSRSIDNISQVNLDSQAMPSTNMRFDFSQVSGSLGDTLRLGKIYLNGSDGNIILNDGTNDFLLMGEDV